LIGRDTNTWQNGPDRLTFGLVDEASKLNLNTATMDMLQALPNMTAELAANIVAWRQSTNDASVGGAQSETYLRLQPPYLCKNAPFETVDELRLVYGLNLELLYGEDANLNGLLDPNETDGENLPPLDNRDSRLDPGLLEYATVYSREPTTRTNVNNQQQLEALLTSVFDSTRASQIAGQVRAAQGGGAGTGGGPGTGGGGPGATVTSFTSLLEFYLRSGMTAEEFAQIEASLTVTTNIQSLVNVNTASEAVLTTIPGIGTDKASAVVAYRQSNPSQANSIAWVADVLDRDLTRVRLAGLYITAHSYQFTADVAAVGHYGRGYRRVKFVFDTSDGTPRIVYRQDLTHLGWALGKQGRADLLVAKGMR
jgi:DNA uptake protein ComE-like DNA-binding protein